MIIQGCAVVERINVPRGLWLNLMAGLRTRGRGRHESGAFLLGHVNDSAATVEEVVYYDDLDPDAYSTGVCVLYAASFSRLWSLARERKLDVVADVHTHLGGAQQSHADRANPMIAMSGHWALIVERFAKDPVWRHRLGIYRYEGGHRWSDYSGLSARAILNTGTLA